MSLKQLSGRQRLSLHAPSPCCKSRNNSSPILLARQVFCVVPAGHVHQLDGYQQAPPHGGPRVRGGAGVQPLWHAGCCSLAAAAAGRHHEAGPEGPPRLQAQGHRPLPRGWDSRHVDHDVSHPLCVSHCIAGLKTHRQFNAVPRCKPLCAAPTVLKGPSWAVIEVRCLVGLSIRLSVGSCLVAQYQAA